MNLPIRTGVEVPRDGRPEKCFQVVRALTANDIPQHAGGNAPSGQR